MSSRPREHTLDHHRGGDDPNRRPTRRQSADWTSVAAPLGALRACESARTAAGRHIGRVVTERRVEHVLRAQELNGLHQRNQDAVPQDD